MELDWALAIGSTERVAVALKDVSDFFNPDDLDDEIPLHAKFDGSFELLPTGANNAPNGIAIGTTVAVGIPNQDNPTVENLTDEAGYPLALLTVTAKTNAAVTFRYIGVTAKADAAAAATTAAAAAFGPRLGAPVTIPRDRFDYYLRTKPALANLVAMMMAPDAAPPNYPGIPPAADTSGLLVAAMRTTEIKSTATTRLLKVACLADDKELLRKMFVGLPANMQPSPEAAGYYSVAGIRPTITAILDGLADHDDDNKIALTDDDLKRLLLLDSPPFDKLATPTDLKNVTKEMFSEMVTVGAMLLQPLYGHALATAIQESAALLKAFCKKPAYASITVPTMFKLITKRVTRLCDHAALDPRQLALDAGPDANRPLPERLARALRFTDVDTALINALREADKVESRALIKETIRTSGNGGGGKGVGGGGGGKGRVKRGRDDTPTDNDDGRKRTRQPPTFDNEKWRTAMPTDLPNGWVRPCFFYACGEGACKNKQECQQTPKRKHNDWGKGLSADLKARTKAWMKTHWVFAQAADTTA